MFAIINSCRRHFCLLTIQIVSVPVWSTEMYSVKSNSLKYKVTHGLSCYGYRDEALSRSWL